MRIDSGIVDETRDATTRHRRARAPDRPCIRPPRPAKSHAMRALYLALGGICLALAIAGVVLPVLPTTPFLLLASGCFVRSSPRLDAWMRSSRLFGPFLNDWARHHGVRLHVKLTALSTIAIVVAWSLCFSDLSNALRGVLLGLAVVGVVVVARLKTIEEPRSGS